MVRFLLGGFAGAAAIMVVGFLFWASPLSSLAYGVATPAKQQAIGDFLGATLPRAGRYVVPLSGDVSGAGAPNRRGVAVIDYNPPAAHGPGGDKFILGFLHQVLVSLLLSLALRVVADRVTQFRSRAQLVIAFAATFAVMTRLNDPIFTGVDWRYAVYALVADIAMMSASGLVIARWFLPNFASSRMPSMA